MEARTRLAAVVGAAALSLIAGYEGLRQRPYLDAVQIPTVCYGHTGPDIQPRWYSAEECRTMLAQDASKAAAAVRRLARVPMTQPVFDALTSFTFNVGEGNLASSTLLRKLNAGDTVGACNELPRWNKAGGRVLPGLVARRAAEQQLCLSGT
jgi:lysozyme